jgi:hypothetical protein
MTVFFVTPDAAHQPKFDLHPIASDLLYGSMWYQTNDPFYGNCYTFNAKYNSLDSAAPRPRYVTYPGRGGGLSMIMHLAQNMYM